MKNAMKCCLIRLLLATTAVVAPSAAFADYAFSSIDYPGAIVTDVYGLGGGQIVGSAAGNIFVTFSYDLRKKAFTTIDTSALPGQEGSVLGINDSGTMVGGSGGCPGSETAFVRTKNGTYTLFSVPTFANAEARGIGNSGLVTGFAYNVDNPIDCNIVSSAGFIYDPSSHGAPNVFLYSVAPRPTIAQGINKSGVVVGSVLLGDGVACPSCLANRYGFLRAPNGAISYFQVNGVDTAARGINDLGVVTGYISLGGGVSKGFTVTLNGLPYESITIADSDLIVFPSALGTLPEAIDNSGDIAGIWIDNTFADHGFVATPLSTGKKR